MIAFLNGRLVQKEPTYLLIDVAGVGYEVKISLQTFEQVQAVNENLRIHTVLIIREDAHTLYGFSSLKEKQIFEQLISVSGIGPNTALIMLSSLSSNEIVQAIVHDDVNTIKSVKGIGLKTAQRAIIELKDKLTKHLEGSDALPQAGLPQSSSLRSEALAALTTLGLPKASAEKSIDLIIKRSGPDLSLEELIKLALK
ncbi:Holliday junction branch migration protein RuvA [Marinilongibacter aquaticus]|uniref:Holliday junction branch migration protein RuvA n=1 Tax=Marinilongibacter aquaticus TaxID=2975157 RepID=UPI0021BD1DE7|nr:Holliday junction branch migration protein RuvA [Marinilongibacter aquaticus]UBM59816.1 Holliday junction branch migration protein RuvA [Marinilongibacter aquaticus]